MQDAYTEAFTFSPVETENGNAIRVEGIRVLTAKVADLEGRGRRQRLTGLEQQDLWDAQSAITTLERMAPVGELLSARAEWLE